MVRNGATFFINILKILQKYVRACILIRKGAEFLLMQEKSRAARAKRGEPGSGAERFQQESSVHDFHSVFWMAVTMQLPALMRKCGIFRQAGEK